MAHDSAERWILAFDASCGTCHKIASAVAQVCEGKLEIRPLADRDVQTWRQHSLGADAPPAPTLMRLRGSDVRAWTGVAMACRLTRRLGAKSAVRVVRSLGELAYTQAPLPGEPAAAKQADRSLLGRSHFLRLGVGAVVAGGLVLTGRLPAFADASTRANSWVKANSGRLPTSYDEVIAYPMEYRKAIFEASTPSVRSRLWVAHLKSFEGQRASFSVGQREVFDRACEIFARESTFAHNLRSAAELPSSLSGLQQAAMDTFGTERAYAIFGTLGPSPEGLVQPAARPNCNCNYGRNWYCSGFANCYLLDCNRSSLGCCAGWVCPCDGMCSQ